jgi:hypothetical protein
MNTMFLVALIAETIFGIGFTLVPGAMLAPFGVSLDQNAIPIARLFGSALLSFPVLLWLGRKSEAPEFRRGVLSSMVTYYLVSTVVLLITQLTGLMNAVGWSVIGLHLVLLAWFGYFFVKQG